MLLPLGKTPNLGFTTSREHPSVRSIPVYAMYLPFLLSSMWAQELFLTDTAAAFQRARQEKKHLFIYFTATWCGPCRFLEREVWPLPQFQALTSRFVRLKVIAQSEEASTPGSEALRLRYGIRGFPSFVLAEPSGRAYYAWSGLSSIEELEKHLKQAEEVQRGAYRRRFDKGDRDTTFLWEYLQTAFNVRDSVQFFKILREYVRVKGSLRRAWEESKSASFIEKMAQAGDPYARYVWQNIDSLRVILRPAFYESVGEALLSNLLDSAWNRYGLPKAKEYCDSLAKAYKPLFPSAPRVGLEFVAWKLIDSQDSLVRREGLLRMLSYLWQVYISQLDTLRDTFDIGMKLVSINNYVSELVDKSPSAEMLWTFAALMREAILRMPDMAFLWETLGDIYKALHEKSAALYAYRTALQKAEAHPVLEYPRLTVTQNSPSPKKRVQQKIQEVEAWRDP